MKCYAPAVGVWRYAVTLRVRVEREGRRVRMHDKVSRGMPPALLKLPRRQRRGAVTTRRYALEGRAITRQRNNMRCYTTEAVREMACIIMHANCEGAG